MKKPKPPKSIEEVKAYIKEKGLRVDAKVFWRYFTEDEPHWHDSNGKPVLSWKKKLLTWDSYSTKPKPMTAAELSAQKGREIQRYKQGIRDRNEDYLKSKSTKALLDIKKDGGYLSSLCGWLIDEIIANRKNQEPSLPAGATISMKAVPEVAVNTNNERNRQMEKLSKDAKSTNRD